MADIHKIIRMIGSGILRKEKSMKDVVKCLSNELDNMNRMKERVEKSIEQAPKGILRISKSNDCVQYYVRRNKKDRCGRYLDKENRKLAYKLAQKEYEAQVLKVIEEQKGKLQRLLSQINTNDIANIYEQLSPERQKLVQPYVLPNEQYIAQWENIIYQGKEFDKNAPEIYTERGERVRSKSEKILADKFYMLGIPYRYEYPLHLQGYGIVHPDFLILNKKTRKEYYWEHLGKMDDPEYCKKAIKKIGSYQRNHIFQGKKLLLTYETSTYPLNMKSVDDLINEFLL